MHRKCALAEVKTRASRIEFKRGDASRMPFESSVFNFVVTSGSLHHWKEPIEVLNEIYQVLKEGKKALVSDPRRGTTKEQIEALTRNIDSKFMRWGLGKSFREGYTKQEIENLVKDTKFTDFKINIEGISLEIWLAK